MNEVGLELSEELETKVLQHKQRFARIFYKRYLELLPTLIHYKNEGTVGIDFLKVEIALNGNYDIVIGENKLGVLTVLGFTTTSQTESNPTALFATNGVQKDDITFLIDKKFIPNQLQEITYQDGCTTGNFVVLRNKALNYQSDVEIIQHYVAELAEIVLSRYSLTMQAKIITFFISDPNDETINQLITKMYNGAPVAKVTKFFDPLEQIINVAGAGNIPSNLQSMKDEYQNIISELNNTLGVNSLAVDKASGVSDAEANSNRGFTTANANIKLVSRNHGLKRLNKRYGLKLEAVYNDEVQSEESEKIESDNNTDGRDSERTPE